jgi:Holliday junction DNA helicase RuvA
LLPNGDFIKLFTHLQIKKMHILYLDLLKSQKRFFKLLLSVSGIGANIARTMLSSLDPKQITNAIASADDDTVN